MAVTEAEGRRASYASRSIGSDETKNALKTTEFVAMVGVIAAILIATWVSDTLNDVRGWTLVAGVAIGYLLSGGLAMSGSWYLGGVDALNRLCLVAVPRRSGSATDPAAQVSWNGTDVRITRGSNRSSRFR
jgi:hypothetical protein